MPKRSTRQPSRMMFPHITVHKAQGEKCLTQEKIDQLLGWTVVQDGAPYHLKDKEGNFIFMTKNTLNRPIYQGLLNTYAQEHLRRRWRLNGEPTIIGQFGTVLDGQHSLISCKLAEQMRKKDPEKYAEWWDSPVTMERIIVYGIEENDDTVNTINTGKPRRMNDVLYRSEWFRDKEPPVKKLLAKITSYAIDFLWMRTGADLKSEGYYAPKRTHPEMMDFVRRHPRLLEYASFINDHFGGGQTWADNVSLITPGYATACLYLMASSSSEGDIYRGGDRAEIDLEWENEDAAKDFWEKFSNSDPDMKILRDTLGRMNKPDPDGKLPSTLEKVSVLARAWLAFVHEKPITTPAIKLSYSNGTNGQTPTLKDVPEFGGIDNILARLKHREKIASEGPNPQTKKNVAAPTGTYPKKKKADEEDSIEDKDTALQGTPEETDSPEDSHEALAREEHDEQVAQEEIDTIEQEKAQKEEQDEKVRSKARRMASRTKRRPVPKSPAKKEKGKTAPKKAAKVKAEANGQEEEAPKKSGKKAKK